MPDFRTAYEAIAWMNESVEFSGRAKAYAREELGMADDEPNEATGVDAFTRYCLLADAFDTGRESGDYQEGFDEGWKAGRKPRVVSTVAELTALPGRSVIRDSDGRVYVKAHGRDGTGWSGTGGDTDYLSEGMLDFIVFPATVLWVGGTE